MIKMMVLCLLDIPKFHLEGGLKRVCMVESRVVKEPVATPSNRPIGVFQSLMTGFDKIAAQPLLILPPIILDLYLWLGPRLSVSSFLEELVSFLVKTAETDPALSEQVSLIQTTLMDVGARLNLFALLSSMPVGVPSLMAGRMPILTPLGEAKTISITDPLILFGIIIVLIILAQGFGTQYHLWVARQIALEDELADRWKAWGRMVILSFGLYIALISFLFGLSLVSTILNLASPYLVVIAVVFGFTFVFWVVVYFAFTPHAIIRYRFGIIRSMMESATIVRWNMLPALGYLGLSFAITWLTNQIWFLPRGDSWFTILAIVGHAFVSATLLTGSYAFFQGRREWMLSFQGPAAIQIGQDQDR